MVYHNENPEKFFKDCKTRLKRPTLINVRALQHIRGLTESKTIAFCVDEYFKRNPIPFPNKPNK